MSIEGVSSKYSKVKDKETWCRFEANGFVVNRGEDSSLGWLINAKSMQWEEKRKKKRGGGATRKTVEINRETQTFRTLNICEREVHRERGGEGE